VPIPTINKTKSGIATCSRKPEITRKMSVSITRYSTPSCAIPQNTYKKKSTKLRKQHTGDIIGYRAHMTIASSTSKLRCESTCYREEF
jgi:hypothetical protein